MTMRIAVSSQNFRTVTGHAGKARRFLVYEVDAGASVRETDPETAVHALLAGCIKPPHPHAHDHGHTEEHSCGCHGQAG